MKTEKKRILVVDEQAGDTRLLNVSWKEPTNTWSGKKMVLAEVTACMKQYLGE